MKTTKLVCWQTGGCSCPQSYLTLLSHGLQHTRLPCLSPSPRICSDPCPLSWWCHLTISSVTPFSSCPQFFPASGLFQWASSSHQVVKVLEFQVQYRSFQGIFSADFLEDWLVWSPCCPRDSQQSSPASQFKNINSSMLRLLYGPTLTSIHDYWKNHSLDQTDLCWQSNVSAF